MIYDDYIAYCEEYCAKYGSRTVVLMEVGSFYELYAIKNDEETTGADIHYIADICNLQVSRKNKSVLENNRKNPLMAGFPSFALQKHLQILLANHYTIVLIQQVTPPPNPERKVTEILSPSLQLTPSSMEGNYLMVSMWDVYTDKIGRRNLSLGLCGVDISTGKTWIYECVHSASAIDEFTRCFQMYQPREIVLLGDELNEYERKNVEELVGAKYDTSRSYHNLWDINIKNYENVAYQTAIIKKAFDEKKFGLLNPLEALNMERYVNSRVAFAYMIQFAYEHNDAIVKNLSFPSHLSFGGHCTLEHNSAIQLQLISLNNGTERPLMNILNRCATAFGMRRFREKLLQPLNDSIELEKRYKSIDEMIKSGNSIKIHSGLRNVLDIERMGRRMMLGRFQPADWMSFHTSMESIQNIAELFGDSAPVIKVLVDEITEGYIDIIDLETAAKYNMNEIKANIFKKGIYTEIDGIMLDYIFSFDNLEKLASKFEEGAKVDYNERDGYFLSMTKKRWENSKVDLTSIDSGKLKIEEFKARPISTSSTIVRVTHPWIHKQSDTILKASIKINEMCSRRYKEFVATFAQQKCDFLAKLVEKISDIDLVCTNARNAVDYCYTRPSIVKVEDNASYIKACAMRHPIIETINNDYMYVPNDVTLGIDKSGLLLFGMNSSGKSSLMKAVGLNIIMAQAGMYVAAKDFVYYPYNHIFTRICGNDNLYRGLSSFSVEMLELKNILERADDNSLVLGDEISHGTETTSGLAIVASSIDILTQRKATYIFATHLHDLMKLKMITENTKIKIAHMHIEIDETGKMIFDRKLRDGSGSSLYGLEVCRGLGMSSDFLKMAHSVRCEVEGITSDFVATKKSRYNGTVHVGDCKLCGERAEEVHHINPQMLADKNGFIEHYHKNREFNLIPVCEGCHDKIHSGEISVRGFVATLEGKELVIDKNIKKEKKLIGHEELYERIRYHKNWYIRKTKRSKWNVATEDDIKKMCLKLGMNDFDLDKLSVAMFDKYL